VTDEMLSRRALIEDINLDLSPVEIDLELNAWPSTRREEGRMSFSEGHTFDQAEPAEVLDYLRSRKLYTYILPPEQLHVRTDGSGFLLQVINGGVKEYPVRRALVMKLLKWFSMPPSQLFHLGMETLASVLNDYLCSIRSGNVTVKIENGEALSITSSRYSEILDVDVFDAVKRLDIHSVSRNDFFTRLYSKVTSEVEPVVGDVCGFGYNVLNSETGFRVLSLQHFVLRYVCSNGAIGRSDVAGDSRVHYGIGKGGLKQFLAAEVERRVKDEPRLQEMLCKSVQRSALASVDLVTRRLTTAVGRKHVTEVLSTLSDNPSRYELANVVSALARKLDINKRLQLEHLAGDLMFQEMSLTLLAGKSIRP
jgi:hypothetical protein